MWPDQRIIALWNEFKVKSVGYLGTRSTVKKDKEELFANKERDGDDTIRSSRVRKYAGIPAPSNNRPDHPPTLEVMDRDLED